MSTFANSNAEESSATTASNAVDPQSSAANATGVKTVSSSLNGDELVSRDPFTAQVRTSGCHSKIQPVS
jgi:hypothetical protein